MPATFKMSQDWIRPLFEMFLGLISIVDIRPMHSLSVIHSQISGLLPVHTLVTANTALSPDRAQTVL